jgi:hypothetical protein
VAFVRDASVLDRGRNGDECGAEELGVAIEKAGWEGERLVEASDAAEWLREEIGTIRLCRFWLEACGESGEIGVLIPSGIASGAGMGSPLPAATN